MSTFLTFEISRPTTKMTHTNGTQKASSIPLPRSYLLSNFLKLHNELQEYINGSPVVIDGKSLTLASLTAVGRYQTMVVLNDDPTVRLEVQKSRDTLTRKINKGTSIYGVSTGFGGSASSRTRDYSNLGNALFQMQHCGVLPSSDKKLHVLPLSDPILSTTMPESWIRAAMVVRINSLIRGHSGVRWEILEAMEDALREGIIPMVPLRGSISASGDLSPLSYIAGMLTGNPSIRVFDGDSTYARRDTFPANTALASHGLIPIQIQPKEHLGLLNGTAFSAAVAGLALFDTIHLALLAQVCTAMSTESLLGSRGSFAPFVNEVARPHPGQVEAAATIDALLARSKLATTPGEVAEKCVEEDRGVLKQDRYALRTSPQFIGPQIEDIQAALAAIHQELNSTTDNPLVESATQTIHDTGNFQAMAVTNAMEKTRLSIHHLGRILFAQATEIINPATNKGLPPSLAATDPSLNYHCKGLDIALAAYVSELGFLANPVSTHIQSAEMHNQSINSLALISARATVTSLDVMMMIVASCIYINCQAFDLRALEYQMREKTNCAISEVVTNHFESHIPKLDLEKLVIELSHAFHDSFQNTSTADGPERIHKASKAVINTIVEYLLMNQSSLAKAAAVLPDCQKQLEIRCLDILEKLRQDYLTGASANLHTISLLGESRHLYIFVRDTLGIKMHGLENLSAFEGGLNAKEPTVGESVSLIYEAIRDGRTRNVLVEMLTENI